MLSHLTGVEPCRRVPTKALTDVESLKAVGPPVRSRLPPPDVEAPDVKGDREAEIQDRDENRSPELLKEDPNETSLEPNENA